MEITLFILRLLSAGLLLLFVGILFFYLQRDTQQMARRKMATAIHGHIDVIAPTGEVTAFPLRAVTTIGRAATNNIMLDTDYASGQHALLTLRDNQWWLEDLGSRNGTQLNDIPVTTMTVVSNGDIITIGDINLKIDV